MTTGANSLGRLAHANFSISSAGREKTRFFPKKRDFPAKKRDFPAKKRDFCSEKRAFFEKNVSERKKHAWGPFATAKNAFSVLWRLRTLADAKWLKALNAYFVYAN